MCFVVAHKTPPKIAILYQKNGILRKQSAKKHRIYYTTSFLKKQVLLGILMETSFFTYFSHGAFVPEGLEKAVGCGKGKFAGLGGGW